MKGAAGRRPPKESFVPDNRKPSYLATPNPSDPWLPMTGGGNGRDSDASLCSSRPSSSFSTGPHHRPATIPISDRSYQTAAAAAIKSYLAAHDSTIHFKLKPLPSNKDITETLKFVLEKLGYDPVTKLEEDLFAVLKFSNCPVKINKSALKAPGTPHSFPSVLAVLHWLVQIASYNEHSENSTQRAHEENSMFTYILKSYMHYIRGDDDLMEQEDENFRGKFLQEKNLVEENVKMLMDEVRISEEKLERLRAEKSPLETLEEEKSMLEKDINKFNDLIEQLLAHDANVEKMMEERNKELRFKEEERKRICEENAELKKKVEQQMINARDAERMKRELQLVEREIEEAEVERNKWDEKSWELDADIGRTFKELEALQVESNQAMKRLKLGSSFQYELDAKGSSLAEVLGMDYKSTLKPALASLNDDIKRSSLQNLEELISLQKMSGEIAANIEAKRKRIAAIQSRIDELEIQINIIMKETQDHTSRCATEARQLVKDVEEEAHNLNAVQKEATEFLKNSQAKLQETRIKCEEEVQLCANEFLALIDSVSKHKEFMLSGVMEMKKGLSETAGAVSDIHKASLPTNSTTGQ